MWVAMTNRPICNVPTRKYIERDREGKCTDGNDNSKNVLRLPEEEYDNGITQLLSIPQSTTTDQFNR